MLPGPHTQCPNCKRRLLTKGPRCLFCGAPTVAPSVNTQSQSQETRDQAEIPAVLPEGGWQAIQRGDFPTCAIKPELSGEPIPIERRITIGGPGEYLAVVALLVPLVAECILLLGNVGSLNVAYSVSFS